MNKTRMMACFCGAMSAVLLAGCGGGNTSSASIGGSVTGLAAGTTLVLQDNGADTLNISSNGNFAFAGKVPRQGDYNVTVSTQPAGQTCLVSNGSGVIDFAGNSVGNVAINCLANAPLSVTVTGLTSGAVTFDVTLQNDPVGPDENPADHFIATAVAPVLLPVTEFTNAAFTCTNALPYALPCTNAPGLLPALGAVPAPLLLSLGEVYSVTVSSQPAGQACQVTGNYSGGVVSLPTNASGVLIQPFSLAPISVTFNCLPN